MNINEFFKPGQRSQSCNPLGSSPELNKKAEFLINLILISQSISNKE